MSALFIYLIKANIALILFYSGYHLGLRNLTFYKLNRYYILFAFIFSILYPFVNWTTLFVSSPEAATGLLSIIPDWQQQEIAPVAEGIQWTEWFQIIFWISVSFFIFRMLIKLLGILRIHLKSVPDQWSIFSYRRSKEDIVPFSFWKNIYLNPDKHKEEELENIMNHEYVHVCQLHSTDILLAEIMLCLFWYNPIIWLLRRDVRENIEFITDQKVLALGINKQKYQYSLLTISTLPMQPALGSHYNFNNLKKRIMMMNKKQSSNTHLSKYVFILPAVMISSLIFGISKATESKDIQPVSTVILKEDIEKLEVDHISNPTKQDTIIIKSNEVYPVGSPAKIRLLGVGKKQKNLDHLIDTLENGSLDIRMLGDFGKGNKVVIGKRINSDSLNSNKGTLYIIDGLPLGKDALEKLDVEKIESITILKDASAKALYGDKAKNGVVLVTTKVGSNLLDTVRKGSKSSSGTTTVTVKGDKVLMTKQDGKGSIIAESSSAKLIIDDKGEPTLLSGEYLGKQPIIYIDDRLSVKDELKNLNQNDIKSLTVLKGKSAEALYGLKGGKDGVILIETKSKGKD